MGDFGFITADGVYHVTVYVTDENGNFKILSMKNIRIRPYPTAPKRNSFSIPPSEQKPDTQGPKEIIIEEPAGSCSHCSIPKTKAPELTDIAIVSQDNSAFIQPEYQQPQNPENYPLYFPEIYPQYPPEIYPRQPQTEENYLQQPQETPQEPAQPQYLERSPKQYDDVPPKYQSGQDPKKPVLISAQMQILDNNTDIYAKFPGEREGLPNGLKKDDLQVLLYTFNYTVGFHGHYEEGYTNGYKKGYYFVTGRNGARTRVDYEADDKGFRPRISQEVLDLISEEVPKEATEKDPKYGLKGYEFKWLYYPAESNKR